MSPDRKLPMLQRKWLIGGAALALLGIVVLVRGLWTTDGVAARTQAQARAVPVETATAERKTLPVQLRALGTVTPIASVAIKTQVDTTITQRSCSATARASRKAMSSSRSIAVRSKPT